MKSWIGLLAWWLVVADGVRGAVFTLGAGPLPGTQLLQGREDFSARMVAGIDRFLLAEIERCSRERETAWKRDFSSAGAYATAVEPNRRELRRMIGVIDPRVAFKELELLEGSATSALVAEGTGFRVYRVRWPVFERVWAEGLWLKPSGEPKAWVVALPDAGQTPEQLAGLALGLPPARQFARRLAEHGCSVLCPVLINREDTFSGSAQLARFTNQPHREWVYRQAYMVGRHIIGYEVQKVLAAVDFVQAQAQAGGRVGVIGHGEGGLIALHSAALDTRIQAALVSGYFDSRERVWSEPIYRNVFGFLEGFGDAELATLIAPRTLVVEHSAVTEVRGPPAAREGRRGAAPGVIKTPDYESVEREVERARRLLGSRDGFARLELISGAEGMTTGPGSDRALAVFLRALGMSGDIRQPLADPETKETGVGFDATSRLQRQIAELEEHTQQTFRDSEYARERTFWRTALAGTAESWPESSAAFRQQFHERVIGAFPKPTIPMNVRARPVEFTSGPAITSGTNNLTWNGYEVVLDVFPEVFGWGYLLVPKEIAAGERRPVVVCQHGLEGVPADLITENRDSTAYRAYRAFAARLCERGFVVLAPHNPYRGGDEFRKLQRKANPVGKTLFSLIIAQHERWVEWLGTLPFVDPARIGFYGLSYGGKTAMRVPPVVQGYALSICSGDFNEWVRKNLSLDYTASYMFTGEWEMPEFDLAHSFNYAEMAALIAPRPFMVERGHDDGVGKDEWVAYEFAKVRRFYDKLGVGDRTTIEFFNGGHTINGQGTFEFLHRHLRWPER